MPLRPISLSVSSSTMIKILFSEDLSSQISTENVTIESISSKNILNIKEVRIESRILSIITEPQSNGEFYQIELKSTDGFSFESKNGKKLINDSVSRKIFFIGSETYNPIRDRMILNAPSNYNLESGLIRDFLSMSADEIHRAQRSASELLSDNYIREKTVDELRTRSSGPRDRFINEGVFDIKRVSKNPTGFNQKRGTIVYSNDSEHPRHKKIGKNPISLQESFFTESFEKDTLKVFEKKDIFSLAKSNIIKILEVKAFLDDEEYYYNIEEFKYSILNNFYDAEFSYKNSLLKSNEVSFSKQNNLNNIYIYDKIEISYLYKNTAISFIDDLDAYEVAEVLSESIPYKKSSFLLKNFDIINKNGSTPISNGVHFAFLGSDDKPVEFSKEIPFISKLPSSPGEYSVNYETGEVRVYGNDGSGVENSGVVVSYNYKRHMINNFDYYIVDSDIVFNKSRLILNQKVKIDYNYELVFQENVHYKNMSHIEVLNEKVGPNLSSSFSIKAKNGSINEVFRIKNITTGEVYNHLYSIDNCIYFSGSRSPEISGSIEFLSPSESYEDLSPVSEFYSNIENFFVTSISGSLITVSSKQIDSIDLSSSNYFLVSDASGSILEVKSIVTSGNSIIGFFIGNSSEAPPLNTNVSLSLKTFRFNLDNSFVLDSSGTKIGSYINSSATLSGDIFKKERFGKKLEKYGEYNIDYLSGEVIVAGNKASTDFGGIKYKHSTYELGNVNPIAVTSIKRSGSQFSKYSLDERLLKINDIEKEERFVFEVNSDYQVDIDFSFLKIKNVLRYLDFKNEKIKYIKFNLVGKNILDFKSQYSVKYKEDSENYYFNIKNSNLFFEIKTGNNIVVIDKDINLFIETIYYKNIIRKEEKSIIYMLNKSVVLKVSKGDVIKNNNKNFIVTSKNKTLGTITVVPEKEGDALDKRYSFELFSNLKIENDSIKISKSLKNLKNETYIVSEVSNSDVSIGDKIYVDAEMLPIEAEYQYLKDEIFVSYEYGDNQIEWIDSGYIEEGENYYVTYEYGAMREKLKSNFGNLTQIPFFLKFPLSVDREFYRDAVEGALESFVKGPTVDSVKSITKSIVKTTPEIDEYFYKNWILSRDHLYENKIEYGGNLEFFPVKFKEGLKFSENNYVKISSDSNISKDEGSFSCWVRNDWNGIDNDADISIFLNTLGTNTYSLDLKGDIYDFKNNLSILPLSNTFGIASNDNLKLSLFNWDADEITKKYGNICLYKEIENYSAGVKTKVIFEKKVIFTNIKNIYSKSSITHSSFILNDLNRVFSLDFVLEELSGYDVIFEVQDRDQDLLPIYYKGSEYIKCKCNDPEILDDYIDIKNKSTNIELDQSLSISDLKNDFSKSDFEKFCFIVDESNNIYKIKSVIEENKKIKNIIIFSLPVNNGNIYSDSTKFKNNLIGSKFKIFFAYETINFKQNSFYNKIYGSKIQLNSKLDTTYNYEIEIDAKDNTLNLDRNGKKELLSYSDLKRVSSYRNSFKNLYNSEEDIKVVLNSPGVIYSIYSNNIESEISIESLRIDTENILSVEDVFIGPNGTKLKSLDNFTLNKSDISGMGTVDTKNYEKGVFIGIIENNTGEKDLGESVWIFKFKAPEYIRVVSDISDANLNYEYIKAEYRLDGKISTNGEFSFVSPLSIPIPGYDVIDSGLRKYYKFSGGVKLEDDGWNSIYSLNGDDDFVGEFYKWRKEGDFTSSNSIYKVYDIGPKSLLTTYVFDDNKDVDVSATFKIRLDPDYKKYSKVISGDISGYLIGVSPVVYSDKDILIDIELGVDKDENGIIFYKDKDGNIIDFNRVNWNNLNFNSIKISKKDYIDIYFNDSIINRLKLTELTSDYNVFSTIKVNLNKYDVISKSIIEILSYEYLSNPRYISTLQENDMFYSDSKEIEFSLFLNEARESADGYGDEYDSEVSNFGQDGYLDGYIEDDIDEFIFVADKNRYIFDISGDQNESMSLYKSGNGFLVFEVFDKYGNKYSTQKNIKHFRSGEIHHIGTSWKLNTNDSDEMHIFIDGEESPNLIRFGSNIPIDSYDKFADPEKEVIQNYVVKDIAISETFSVGVSALNSSVVCQNRIGKENEGRFVIVIDSDLDKTLIGRAFIVHNPKDDNSFTAIDPDSMEPFVFSTTTKMSLKYAASVGFEKRNVFTNLKHQKFRVFIDEKEVGSKIYDVNENGIYEVDSDLESSIRTAALISNNSIQFIQKENGKWKDSVNYDSSVHIKSYGLSLITVNETIQVSSEYNEEGISLIRTNLPSPISFDDVVISKILENRFIPDFEIIYSAEE